MWTGPHGPAQAAKRFPRHSQVCLDRGATGRACYAAFRLSVGTNIEAQWDPPVLNHAEADGLQTAQSRYFWALQLACWNSGVGLHFDR